MRQQGIVSTWTIVMAVVMLTSCGLNSTSSSPDPIVCDGIGADMGGCDDHPAFAGSSCSSVAREFGARVDEAALQVVDMPTSDSGEAQSVRLKQALTLLAVLADRRLTDVGLDGQCDPDRFLADAEGEFSDRLRDSVGPIMFDGEPLVDYEEWRLDVRRSLELLGST